MNLNDETIWRILTLIAIPATIYLFKWWEKRQENKIAQIQRNLDIASGRDDARQTSARIFKEATEQGLQNRQSEIQLKLVDFLLASNDGKISEILSTNKDGTSQIVALVLQTSADKAEQGRLIISSLNTTIAQQARILAALLGDESGQDILTKEVLQGLTKATIQSSTDQISDRVATDALHPKEDE